MKPLENIFAPRNGTTCVTDGQHDVVALALRADPDSSAGAIVLSSVLQEILYDKRCVTFLAGHKKTAGKFLFNLYIGRIRQRAKIVQPFIDELAKIDGCRCDLKVACIHARQQKQIVDDARQAVRLMKQPR